MLAMVEHACVRGPAWCPRLSDSLAQVISPFAQKEGVHSHGLGFRETLRTQSPGLVSFHADPAEHDNRTDFCFIRIKEL